MIQQNLPQIIGVGFVFFKTTNWHLISNPFLHHLPFQPSPQALGFEYGGIRLL
jgi:hypothetical protein